MALLPVAPAPYRTKQEFDSQRLRGAALQAIVRRRNRGTLVDHSEFIRRRGTVA